MLRTAMLTPGMMPPLASTTTPEREPPWACALAAVSSDTRSERHATPGTRRLIQASPPTKPNVQVRADRKMLNVSPQLGGVNEEPVNRVTMLGAADLPAAPTHDQSQS